MPRRNRAPLHRRPDSPYWWTHVYVGEQRRRVSTRCTDRKAAAAAALRMQREAVEHRPRAISVEQTLCVYIQERTDWAGRTALRCAQAAAALSRHLGTISTDQLTRADLERFRAARPARTAENELSLLFAALKAARRRGETVPELDRLRPFRLRRDAEQRTRWLSRHEVERLTKQLPGERADWVWIACHTGLRISELNALSWEHFNLDAEQLRVPGTKSKRSKRTLPLSEPVLALLRRRKAADLPPLTPWPRPYAVLERASAAARIEHAIPHDFRRTFASWLLQRGVSHHAISDLLGHAGTHLVRQVYAHLGAADLRAAVKLLT